jgi:hypothetical protein
LHDCGGACNNLISLRRIQFIQRKSELGVNLFGKSGHQGQIVGFDYFNNQFLIHFVYYTSDGMFRNIKLYNNVKIDEVVPFKIK